MIDTVVIRIHNLEKYKRAIRVFEMGLKDRIKTETGFVKTSEFEMLKKKYNDSTQIINSLKLNRTGKFLIKSQAGKKKSHSGNYEFRYSLNWDRDYMEMNFSIPKYVYGMNVLMYVEHYRDRDYKYYENNLLEYNIDKAPTFLLVFIKHFINFQFIDPIDLEDVEVNRIDVCWNQVFNSRDEALYYLEHQKKIRKKHSREEGGLPIDWGTSLMYATARYSLKIYHKGSEYRVHDLKQHLKYNDEKGHTYFKTEKILELADRTLRYEATIRKAELNYLFKQNIFRKNCPSFEKDHKIYSMISAAIKFNDNISKQISILPKSEKKMFRQLNPYKKITKEHRTFYSNFSKMMGRAPKFMMKESEFSKLYNSETLISTNSTANIKCETALFSKQLIALCLKKLYVFIKDFQLKELPGADIISIKIDRYNNLSRVKLPKAEMIKFYDLLLRSGSFKEASRIGRFSKATLCRYKDRFKKIGISENHIKPEENFAFPKAPLDLSEYHSFFRDVYDLVDNEKVKYEFP